MANIQALYIALLGRPADPLGLSYWSDLSGNGTDFSHLGGQWTGQAEFLDRLGNASVSAVIDTIYSNAFGRAPVAAELNFYLAVSEAGHPSMELLAATILNSAGGNDLITLNAKLAAADLFTQHLDSSSEIAAYRGDNAAVIGRAYLDAVTGTTGATAETADRAIATLPADPGNGAQVPGGGAPVEGISYALDAVITPYKIVGGTEQLLIGQGSADGFAITTDTVSHLELGISVRTDAGQVLSSAGYAEGHVATFAVGGDAVLALSVVSLAQRELPEFHFRLEIDTDPTAGIHFQSYLLQGNADIGYAWALDANKDGIANGASDTVQQTLPIGNQQGHFMLLDMFDLGDRTGLIDVRLEAYSGHDILTQSAVRLDFDGGSSLVGIHAAYAEL